MPETKQKTTYVTMKDRAGRSVNMTVYDIDPEQVARRIEKACADKPMRKSRRSEPRPQPP